MRYKIIFFLLLGLDATILLFQTSELSISYYEAQVLYGGFSFLQALTQGSLWLFGENDFGLRFFMIALHLGSAVLMHQISKEYLQDPKARLWLLGVFLLLPGVVSASLIVNDAGLVIFGLFLFVYLYTRISQGYLYVLLLLYLFASGGFMYLFLALMFYAAHRKEKIFFAYTLLLFTLSIALFGIETHGAPQGHFLDSLALYAAVFTPILFVYLFYSLYRRYLTKERDLLWFLGTTALLFSLVLSFRQKVAIEYFAPYLIVTLPLVAKTFYSSYRVRLKEFRRNYTIAFVVALMFLVLHSSVVVFNKYLYFILENPQKHFAYKMHVAKELAQELKNRGIECVSTDERMGLRLSFYGITQCNKFKLTEKRESGAEFENVTISYKNKPVYNTYVTKVNTF